MSQDTIIVKGTREHNLKNIDVAIPRDKLVIAFIAPFIARSVQFSTRYGV